MDATAPVPSPRWSPAVRSGALPSASSTSRAAGSEENYEVLKIASASELTLDRLLEERGCELFGEHDRWFDLKRTGTLLTRARLNPLVEHYNNLSEIHLVRPIPYNERIKLKGLDQNEGYNN